MSYSALAATASNIVYDDATFPMPYGSTNSKQPHNLTPISLTVAEHCAVNTTAAARITVPHEGYVSHLIPVPSTSLVAAAISASQPNGQYLWVLDLATGQVPRKFLGHQNYITALRSVPELASVLGAPTALISSSEDGTVRFWDDRDATGTACIQMTSPNNKPLLSFDVARKSLGLLAAGSEASGEGSSIFYWDVRNNKNPVYRHDSTHSDNITSLHFVPTTEATTTEFGLLSGSTDGLISLTNANELDEDEAVLNVCNWGASVSKCGYVSGEGIWAASDMETFVVLDPELNSGINLGDMRQLRVPDTWESNYIIDAGSYKQTPVLFPDQPARHNLGIWMGSNSGDFALVTPVDRSNMTIQRVCRGTHNAIVRSIAYVPESNCIVSGGEDATIAIWSLNSAPTASATPFPSAPMEEDAGMDTSEPPPTTSGFRKRKNTEDHRDEAEDDADRPGKKGKRGF